MTPTRTSGRRASRLADPIRRRCWQRDWLQGERLEEQLSYWRTQLADAPPLLELPTDRPRPKFKTFHGADVRLSFSKSLSEDITRLSRDEGVTLFMTLAAFSTFLYRYSGQRTSWSARR